jgi:DNA-binding response OmpR family regulator
MRPSKAKKILTVDDDEDLRSTISDRLSLEGFDTVWAKNGRVALEYMNATNDNELPDLILLDYMMPIMNGQEFCKEKAKIQRLKHIPVVMMTASGNLVNIMDKIDTNANAYMSKPMDDTTIVNMVRHFLDHMPEPTSELTELVTTNPEMMNETLGVNIEPGPEGTHP